jgi:hypothetical protein
VKPPELAGAAQASFTWRDRTLSVTVPDPSYVVALAHFIGVTPGHLLGDEHITLARSADGDDTLVWTWRFGAGVARSRNDAIATLLTQLCFQFLAADGCYALHAAGIVVDGKARLMLGPGHIGKSTLTVEAWLAGYEVLGDDYLALDIASGRIEPVPKPLKLRLPAPVLPSRLGAVRDDGACVGLVDGLPVVKLARALPGMAPLGRRYEIDAVFVLNRSGATPTASIPASKYEVIQALLEQTFIGKARSLGVLAPFAPAIRGGRARILSVADDDLATALGMLTAPL